MKNNGFSIQELAIIIAIIAILSALIVPLLRENNTIEVINQNYDEYDNSTVVETVKLKYTYDGKLQACTITTNYCYDVVP